MSTNLYLWSSVMSTDLRPWLKAANLDQGVLPKMLLCSSFRNQVCMVSANGVHEVMWCQITCVRGGMWIMSMSRGKETLVVWEFVFDIGSDRFGIPAG